jgi:FixJ family two-component response regulator
VLEADPSVRVLFISGYSSDLAGLGFPRVGTGFLQKPFSAAKLIESVKTVLRDESSPGQDQ